MKSERIAGFHTALNALSFATKKDGKHSHVWPQNGPLATPKQHGTEGRIVTSVCGCWCLKSLSESIRNYCSSKLQLSGLSDGSLATPKQHGTEARIVTSVCGCWCLKSLSESSRNELQAAALRLLKRIPRHTETAWH